MFSLGVVVNVVMDGITTYSWPMSRGATNPACALCQWAWMELNLSRSVRNAHHELPRAEPQTTRDTAFLYRFHFSDKSMIQKDIVRTGVESTALARAG